MLGTLQLHGPVWVLFAAQPVANVALALVLVGAAARLLPLPRYKRAWMLEAASLAMFVGAVGIMLALAAVVFLLVPLLGLLIFLPVIGWVVYWLPRSRRTYTVVADAVIPASPEEVFRIITDVSLYPRLNPMIVEATVEGGEPLKVGSRIQMRVRAGSQGYEGTDVVTVYEPSRAYGDRSLVNQSNDWRVTLTPVASGTLIRSEYCGTLAIANALIGGYAKGRVARASFEARQKWFGAIAREAAAGV